MFVRMWMTKKVISIPSETSILEARDIMRENAVRRLVVLRDEKLVGIVTEGDIQEAGPSEATSLSVWRLNYLLARATIEEVMTRDVITVSPLTPIEEVALIMRQKKIGGLPVIEKDKLIGIITESDIFEAFSEVMGLRQGGVRLTIESAKHPGSLADALNVIEKQNMRLLSVVICEKCRTGPETDVIVIRVQSSDYKGIVLDLRKAGIKVLDARH